MQIEELKSRLSLLEHVNHGLLRPFLATNPSREPQPKSPVSEGRGKVVPLAHKSPKQATEEGARKNAQTQHKASLNKSADSLLKDMKAMGAKLPEFCSHCLHVKTLSVFSNKRESQQRNPSCL